MIPFDDMPVYSMAEWMAQKAALAHANERLNRAEAALCLIKGLCEVRNRGNDEIMGYRDPLIEKILSAIVKATS